MKKIATDFTSADWKQLDFSKSGAWETAADIFHDRMQSRFMRPLAKVLPKEGSGFLVTAVHCLLIEMFEQFRRGVDDTPRRKGAGEEFFVSFLRQPEFAFNESSARTFYDHFRCGLHHQGQTKKDSRIMMTGELLTLMGDGESLRINRTKFHEAMVRWVDKYTQAIRDGSDQLLRENFKKKMNYICS